MRRGAKPPSRHVVSSALWMLSGSTLLSMALVIPPSPLPNTRYARVPASDLDAAYAIEAAGYPADEAATREKLDFRLKHAGDYFWGAYSEHGALLGFVCGTLTKAETLTEESMSEHDADGSTLCIHSVVTLTALRRKGLGQWMVRAYRASVAALPTPPRRVVLMCKEPLVQFYSRAGFELIGPSGVVHGQDPWLLMSADDASRWID